MKKFDYKLASKTITYDRFSQIEGVVMIINVIDLDSGDITPMGVRAGSFGEAVKILKKKLGDKSFRHIP